MKYDKRKLESFLGAEGKKVLLYHTDTDGICSAALFLKFFKGYAPLPLEGPVIDKKLLRMLREMKPSLIVMLDLPMDQESEKLEKILRDSLNTRMIMIDHHIPDKDMNSGRFIHINPRFGSTDYIPASVLVYRMLLDMGMDADRLVWIAAAGVIGDYAYQDCGDVLDECEDMYPKCARVKNPKMATLSKELMATVINHGLRGADKSLKIMAGAEDYRDALGNSYLKGCYAKVEKEIRKTLSAFPRKAKEYPNLGLFIYKVESPFNIASTISTRLAEKHPDRMIFVIKDSKQMVKVSARYQPGDISLNDILKKAVKGIGSGGGHVKAAGAVVPKKHWHEFEQRLMSLIEEAKAAA
jgi:single-stranded DNA-specific DHH superfamily exonuclease